MTRKGCNCYDECLYRKCVSLAVHPQVRVRSGWTEELLFQPERTITQGC